MRDSEFLSNVVYIFESTFEGLYFSDLLCLQEIGLNIYLFLVSQQREIKIGENKIVDNDNSYLAIIKNSPNLESHNWTK